MQLQSFTVYDLAALDAVATEAPSPENQFARLVVAEIAAFVGHSTREVHQYSTYFAGNIITDEGLAIDHTETLSLNDDHDNADDLAYALSQMAGYQFGVFCWFEKETLTVIYFAE